MSTDDSWASVEVLAEPTRRRIYELVRRTDGPVTREAAAEATGISARLAAFHLERLAAAGLLDFDYARPEGAGGPGAGRPAKRYRPAAVHVSVVLPPRRFELAARILAAAVAGSPRSVGERVVQQARSLGRQLGQAHEPATRSRRAGLSTVAECLTELGYEPATAADRIALRNCPFHEVVDSARDVVCALNLGLVQGALDGLGATSCAAERVPAPPGCCVAVTRRGRAARGDE